VKRVSKTRETLILPLEFGMCVVGVEVDGAVEVTFQERLRRRIERHGGILQEDEARKLGRWLLGADAVVEAVTNDETTDRVHRMSPAEQTRAVKIRLPGDRAKGEDEGGF
jgi:hypothetical protein